jgi:hypothetical protein
MKTLRRTASTILLLAAAPHSYAASATSEQILAAVSGNTIQGNMDSTGPYVEFYAPDGVVFGKDYKTKWSVEDNKMCWVYDGSPKDCWGVEIEGDQVKWLKDSKPQGSGTVLKGNTNGFK